MCAWRGRAQPQPFRPGLIAGPRAPAGACTESQGPIRWKRAELVLEYGVISLRPRSQQRLSARCTLDPTPRRVRRPGYSVRSAPSRQDRKIDRSSWVD